MSLCTFSILLTQRYVYMQIRVARRPNAERQELSLVCTAWRLLLMLSVFMFALSLSSDVSMRSRSLRLQLNTVPALDLVFEHSIDQAMLLDD